MLGTVAWENTDILFIAIVVNNKLFLTTDPGVSCLVPASMTMVAD